jgi:hypothetical protein
LVGLDASYDNLIEVLKLYDAGDLWPHQHRPRRSLVDLIPPPTPAEASCRLPLSLVEEGLQDLGLHQGASPKLEGPEVTGADQFPDCTS